MFKLYQEIFSMTEISLSIFDDKLQKYQDVS